MPSDDERLLEQMRQWLAEVQTDSNSVDPLVADWVPEPRPMGLYQFAEEFTALRHELKLQTRSARGQTEQVDKAIAALDEATRHFMNVEPREEQAAWKAGRRLAEALVDLDEALDRGHLQMERARHRLVVEAPQAFREAMEQLLKSQGGLTRFLIRGYHRRVLNLFDNHVQRTRHEVLDALLEGYGLLQNRLRRALKTLDIMRIETVGKAVDPQRMTVIEVVEAADHLPGRVVDELRRGYIWNDRVIRPAEVRASRGLSPPADDLEPGELDALDASGETNRPSSP